MTLPWFEVSIAYYFVECVKFVLKLYLIHKHNYK